MNRAKHDNLTSTEADRFGLASAALLRQGVQNLPANVKDSLYAARMKALSVSKAQKVAVRSNVLAGNAGNWSSHSSPLWDSVRWAAPVAFLVLGLYGIAQWQQDSRINDIAQVDAALLTDDVPPDAYADSGFLSFLKNGPLSDSDSDSDSDSASLDPSHR